MILSTVTGFFDQSDALLSGITPERGVASGERCGKKGKLADKLMLKIPNYSPLTPASILTLIFPLPGGRYHDDNRCPESVSCSPIDRQVRSPD